MTAESWKAQMRLFSLALSVMGIAALAFGSPAIAQQIKSYDEVAGNTTTASTTTDSDPISVTAGDTLIVMLNSCPVDAHCFTTGTAHVSGISARSATGALGTCQLATGAQPSAAVALTAEIWYCPVTTTGQITVEATWAAGVYYSNIGVADVSGSGTFTDDGKGNFVNGTGTPMSATTNGSTTAANEIIVATGYPTGASSMSAGTGYTYFTNSSYNEYSLTNSAGSNTATINAPTNTSKAYGMAIAAFKYVATSTPTGINYTPSYGLVVDTSASGTSVASFVVQMQDSSTYSGTNTLLAGSDALCHVPATGNGAVTLASTVTSANVGAHTCKLQASENSVNKEVDFTFNVDPAVQFTDGNSILPGLQNGYFLGLNGAWAMGQPATIWNGTGSPAAALGNNGDLYVDTAGHVLYGPKASGTWPSGVALIGPAGPPGQMGNPGQNAGQNTYPACPAHTATATVGQSMFCSNGANTDIAVAPAANTWLYFGPASTSAP